MVSMTRTEDNPLHDLRERRTRVNMSQRTLAQKTGLAVNTIGHIERRGVRPQPLTVKAVNRVLRRAEREQARE